MNERKTYERNKHMLEKKWMREEKHMHEKNVDKNI